MSSVLQPCTKKGKEKDYISTSKVLTTNLQESQERSVVDLLQPVLSHFCTLKDLTIVPQNFKKKTFKTACEKKAGIHCFVYNFQSASRILLQWLVYRSSHIEAHGIQKPFYSKLATTRQYISDVLYLGRSSSQEYVPYPPSTIFLNELCKYPYIF